MEDVHLSQTVAEYRTHATTYHRFMLAVKWIGIALASAISFLVLYFASDASLLGALVVGVVIFAIGAWAMSHGLQQSSEPEDAPGLTTGEH